jgi:hypothetical protein
MTFLSANMLFQAVYWVWILQGPFEEITAQITVFILLELKSSPCMTSTGRSLAGSDPLAKGK